MVGNLIFKICEIGREWGFLKCSFFMLIFKDF